jgi:glycosyltransferase involved in cell wall biosynthesis
MKDYSKVLIATPIRGNQTVTLYTAGLLQSAGLHGGWLPMAGQSDIYVARNVLINEFLARKNFDTLVFIDSDIGFTREQLKALIDTDEPFVSGLYTDKCQPPMPFCRDNMGRQLTLDEIPKEGMLEARFVPGGFLKIDRSVPEKMIATGKIATYGMGRFHHFYFGRIVFDNLLSEDYSFSDLVYNMGITPWINCGIRLNHDGRTCDPQPQPVVNNPTPEQLKAAGLNPAVAALLEDTK